MASAFAAGKDLDAHTDMTGNFRVSSGCGNNLTLSIEAVAAGVQQADKLGGTATGVCLPVSHSGAVTMTCADLADLDDDEDDCGEPFGKTLTVSTEAPSEPSTPEYAVCIYALFWFFRLADLKAISAIWGFGADRHFLWKMRHTWAVLPEESWGSFLQGLEDALLPSSGLRVQLVEPQDWSDIKSMCTRLPPSALSKMVAASLHFYHCPKPKMLLRLTTLLKQHLS
ncbi:unnamed protein product [Symbiodinium sp. CCMP2456]|nr:unnamed protein product [Symbiodinium sp. CCMP2456]